MLGDSGYVNLSLLIRLSAPDAPDAPGPQGPAGGVARGHGQLPHRGLAPEMRPSSPHFPSPCSSASPSLLSFPLFSVFASRAQSHLDVAGANQWEAERLFTSKIRNLNAKEEGRPKNGKDKGGSKIRETHKKEKERGSRHISKREERGSGSQRERDKERERERERAQEASRRHRREAARKTKKGRDVIINPDSLDDALCLCVKIVPILYCWASHLSK